MSSIFTQMFLSMMIFKFAGSCPLNRIFLKYKLFSSEGQGKSKNI